MKIYEIFYSIQGEGKWMGLPNIFIRTTGCNLRCTYCDTQYAYHGGEELSIDAIVEKVRSYSCRHICITGGEPLLQDESLALIDALMKEEYWICLETNGSKCIKQIVGKKGIMISLDIKCPSSMMHQQMDMSNISYLTVDDQLKFVVKTKQDYEYAKAVVSEYAPQCAVFFQAVWGSDFQKLASWILKDGLQVRMGVQLQKIIWGEKQGV